MNLAIFREYEPHELGDDHYPRVWKRGVTWELPDDLVGRASAIVTLDPASPLGVKDVVRAEAGERCVRCGHPFTVGRRYDFEDADDLHARRTARDIGYSQEVVDIAFVQLLADGATAADPAGARRTLWSPCDVLCTHGGPIRYRALDRFPPGTDVPWLRDDDPFVEAGAHVEHGREVQAAWRILTVHHINGRKHDLRWWNLAALCQRCHLIVQRKVHLERVYPFEHTDWFKPYAAGWYAYAYLGLSLDRDQVMERLDELLALERMA